MFILNIEDRDGAYFFNNLGTTPLYALGIPHANAEVERMFSLQNDSKNRKTDRMQNDTVDGHLRVRQAVLRCKKPTIEPTPCMIDRALDCQFYKAQIVKAKNNEVNILQ